jgi:hypothetical protein
MDSARLEQGRGNLINFQEGESIEQEDSGV